MIKTFAYAATSPTSGIVPYQFERRSPRPHDVVVDILYSGICHSDIHQSRGEWGPFPYPMVPGHEIVGKVHAVGSAVTKFKVGDLAGVGVFVDSCRACENCKAGLEQYCNDHVSWTYGSTEQDKKTPTYGGYSSCIVADENYTLKIPSNLKLEAVAPLLCAGITTYSPLRHWKVGPGHKVGVIGLGGLGHMALKFAASFGAEVYALSTSPEKEGDARKLGAHQFVLHTDDAKMAKLSRKLDFIIDNVAAPHDINKFLNLLKLNGTLCLVGLPEKPLEVSAFSLVTCRRSFAGSGVGSIGETQEMLDYCGTHNITADIELIGVDKINDAYERTVKGDVKYRFVIDMKTLKRS